MLTGNGDVPHRECTSSPGMHNLTGNAHSLYRVRLFMYFAQVEIRVKHYKHYDHLESRIRIKERERLTK